MTSVPARAALPAVLAGIGVAVVALLLGGIAGLASCPPHPAGPVIALELVRTPYDLLMQLRGPACVAGQRSALWLDGLAFIPLYTAFLVGMTGVTLANRPARLAVATLAILGGLLDQVEGLVLSRLMDADGGQAALLAVLFGVVRTKFLVLALATMGLGFGLAQRRGWRRSLGYAVVAGGAGSMFGFRAGQEALLTTGTAIAWALLLAYALVALSASRRSASPSSR